MITLHEQVEDSQQQINSDAVLVEFLLQQNYTAGVSREDCDSCGEQCSD